VIKGIPKAKKREILKREGFMKYSTIVTERTLNLYGLSNCKCSTTNLRFNIFICDNSTIIVQDAKVQSHTSIVKLPSNVACNKN